MMKGDTKEDTINPPPQVLTVYDIIGHHPGDNIFRLRILSPGVIYRGSVICIAPRVIKVGGRLGFENNCHPGGNVLSGSGTQGAVYECTIAYSLSYTVRVF